MSIRLASCAAILALLLTSNLGYAADRSVTIPAGKTLTVYEFANLRGKICLRPSKPVRVHWIYTGTNYPKTTVKKQQCLELAKKINGELRVHNPNSSPVKVRVQERTKVANPLETAENAVGSLAGGRNSVPNEIHRGIKDRLKKPFG